jgi:hypothetical protein
MAYNPDEHFSVRAIVKLERGVWNIPVLTSLQPKLSELKKRAGFKLLSDQEYKTDYGYDPSLTVKYINSWVKAKNCVTPTWKNFLKILKDISPNLSKLSDEIEFYIAGKGRSTYYHQARDSHVIKDNTTNINLNENIVAGDQISQTVKMNADKQNVPKLRDNSRNQKYQEDNVPDQTNNNQDNFIGRKSIPVNDKSDETSFDNRKERKYHQIDGKPDSTNNQNSLRPDDTLYIDGDRKQKDQPSSSRIASHGLTSYSPMPSMHQQLESISKLAPEWMQEPDNKLRQADGQINSKYHLRGIHDFVHCLFAYNNIHYVHTVEGTIKDLFEMKVVQVAMLIILALLTVCCGFHMIRGQQSQRQRISQGKPPFSKKCGTPHVHYYVTGSDVWWIQKGVKQAGCTCSRGIQLIKPIPLASTETLLLMHPWLLMY